MSIPHRLSFGSAYGRKAGVDSEVGLAHIGQPKAFVPDHQLEGPAIVFKRLLLRLYLSELYELQVRPLEQSLLPSRSSMIVPRISVRQQQHHSYTSGLSLTTSSSYPGHFLPNTFITLTSRSVIICHV